LDREILAAIKEDHAHPLVLGCTGMVGVVKEMEKQLRRDGYEAPVVDPVAASLKFAAGGKKTGTVSPLTGTTNTVAR
jgi:Asp/Glu/hydantoin racemase